MLGYQVGGGVVNPNYVRLELLAKFKRPKSVHDVQSLYEVLSYFRQFIPIYTSITASIAKLLRKGTELQWTQQHTRVVKRVIEQLGAYAGLHISNPDLPFVLEAVVGSEG